MNIGDSLEVTYPPEPPVGSEVYGKTSLIQYTHVRSGWVPTAQITTTAVQSWSHLVKSEGGVAVSRLPLTVGSRVCGEYALAQLPNGTVLTGMGGVYQHIKIGRGAWLRYADDRLENQFAERSEVDMQNGIFTIKFLPRERK